MLDYIIYIIAFFITIPFAASLIVFLISKTLDKKSMKAIHRTVNWTTIFYLISVWMMMSLIFGKNYIGIIFIGLLCILTLIVFFQWKWKQDIQFIKAVKLCLRISFLLFFIMYIVFAAVGIGKYILV